MPRNPHRSTARTTRALVCAGAAVALPVLLVSGCSSDSGGGDKGGSPSAAKSSSAPKPAPVKYKELPEACKTLSKKTVKDLAPKTDDAGGKRIGTGDTGDSGSCLWSGLQKYDYRQLTVSLKRFDSDTARGSGDKLAGSYQEQQAGDLKDDKDVKKLKKSSVSGIGDQAESLGYETKKKGKKNSEEFRSERLIARASNVVVTVDYEGAGFESGKKPSADDLHKKTQKAAKEAIGALK